MYVLFCGIIATNLFIGIICEAFERLQSLQRQIGLRAPTRKEFSRAIAGDKGPPSVFGAIHVPPVPTDISGSAAGAAGAVMPKTDALPVAVAHPGEGKDKEAGRLDTVTVL
eukprot:g5509.t1